MFAKDGSALTHLKAQFLRREPERVDLAVVYGHLTPEEGTWRDRLVWDGDELIQRVTNPKDPRGTEAVSTYRVVERLRGASLLEVRLVTGKRNQIRLQAELRGHPLVGEKMYADTPVLRRIAFPRQALHAWKLGFEHPVTGRALRLESPVPRDLSELLSRLKATPPTRRAPG
jgi:23S rRNA pseudouridine1911/1915/1917 synthase